ncbi:MAG: succinylglutamate desuccinylase [Thermodesulfobacteriota bacterium]
MRSKVVVGLLVVVVAVFFVSSLATAQKLGSAKLLCVSKTQLKGEETVASCLAKGERFAVVDPYGMVRILSPEEVELTKAFNPKAFETRAFGMNYIQLAPPLPALPSLTKEAP